MGGRHVNVTFHGIGPRSRIVSAGEEAVWLEEVPFAAILDRIAACDDVAITFDDGNASDVEIALPALRERGLRATFFVCAGRLGEHGFLDRDGVAALAAAGMGVGSHGMRHRAWRGLSDEDLNEELVAARAALAEAAGRPVTEAACPFGAYDRRVLRALRAAGYERVYTSDEGPARPGAWLEPRNTLRREDGPEAIDRMRRLAPRAAAVRRVKTTIKRWR